MHIKGKGKLSVPLIVTHGFEKNEHVTVPVGFAKFPKELPAPLRSYIEKYFNIRHWTTMPAGGHFAAVEQPELLSKDIINFFFRLV